MILYKVQKVRMNMHVHPKACMIVGRCLSTNILLKAEERSQLLNKTIVLNAIVRKLRIGDCFARYASAY